MRCACESVFALTGNEAAQYASEHLFELEVDAVNWTVRYQCPATRRIWLCHYPHGELHGGGPPRLRQLDQSGEPIAAPSQDPFR
jgi:hypothetical protein